jgi:exonuclease VII small subunit
MTLEEKLLRLKEIQSLLEQKKVNLTQSIELLEEAFKLKEEVKKELEIMENRLINLTKDTEN